MKHFIIISYLLCCVAQLSAQDFATPWISYPEPDDTSQIWFRQTYISKEKPANAIISVTTTGLFELYINEISVGLDAIRPYRQEKTDNPIITTYNVTRFLRPDSNTIAIWYSPSYPHINKKQIAVSYYGQTEDSCLFSYNSDTNWLCHKANISLSANGSEIKDGNFYNLRWNSNEFDPACWLAAEEVTGEPSEAITQQSPFDDRRKIIKVRRPNYFDIKGDTVIYDFGEAFYGYVRLTLREAKRGEHIHIGDMEYICNGEIDEQAYGKFVTIPCQRVEIYGDDKFKRENITNVEGIEIGQYYHNSYMY